MYCSPKVSSSVLVRLIVEPVEEKPLFVTKSDNSGLIRGKVVSVPSAIVITDCSPVDGNIILNKEVLFKGFTATFVEETEEGRILSVPFTEIVAVKESE